MPLVIDLMIDGHRLDFGEIEYPALVGGEVLEFTIAFIPVEGALSSAIAVDLGLQVDAFAKRVALATPNTLMAVLSLCGRIWQREQVRCEAEEIGRSAVFCLPRSTTSWAASRRSDRHLKPPSPRIARQKRN